MNVWCRVKCPNKSEGNLNTNEFLPNIKKLRIWNFCKSNELSIDFLFLLWNFNHDNVIYIRQDFSLINVLKIHWHNWITRFALGRCTQCAKAAVKEIWVNLVVCWQQRSDFPPALPSRCWRTSLSSLRRCLPYPPGSSPLHDQKYWYVITHNFKIKRENSLDILHNWEDSATPMVRWHGLELTVILKTHLTSETTYQYRKHWWPTETQSSDPAGVCGKPSRRTSLEIASPGLVARSSWSFHEN